MFARCPLPVAHTPITFRSRANNVRVSPVGGNEKPVWSDSIKIFSDNVDAHYTQCGCKLVLPQHEFM